MIREESGGTKAIGVKGRRRGAAGVESLTQGLSALSELKKRSLPGRNVFSLRAEVDENNSVTYMEGKAQIEELKGITGAWLKYFNEKQVNPVLSDAVERMLHLVELPENPYLNLANQLRTSELSFGLAQRDIVYGKNHEDVGGVDFIPEVCQEECPLTSVTCVKFHESAWGNKNVLQLTDPEALASLLWRVGSFESALNCAETKKGEYKLRYVTAMTGVGIFHGRLLPYLPSKIDLQHDCHVTGPKFEKAVGTFAQLLIREVELLAHDPNVVLIGVNVESTSYGKGGKSNAKKIVKLWTASKIKGSHNSFISSIKAATVGKRRITLDFIGNIPCHSAYIGHMTSQDKRNNNDEESDDDDSMGDSGFVAYNTINSSEGRMGQGEAGQVVSFSKLYTMHFQQTDKQGSPKGKLRSFAMFPFSSFCLGVFRTKEDAQFYVSLHKTEQGDCWTMSMRERFNSFRVHLKTTLIRKFIGGDLTDAVESLIGLLAMAGHYTVIDDIMRLVRSSAGQLRGVICWNTAMCRTLEHLKGDYENSAGKRRERGAHLGFSDPDFVDHIVHQFPAYRRAVLRAMMDTDSSDVIAMQRPVQHALYDMCDHVSKRLVIDERHTISHLQHIRYMCTALELTVSRDVVEVLTNPYFHKSHTSGDTLIGLIEDVTSQVIERTTAGAQTANGNETGETRDAAESSDHDIFSEAGVRSIEAFASEAKAAQQARQHIRVVSIPEAIKEAKKKRTVPMEIAKEATILEYVVDTRLDKVIEGITMDLLTKGRLLPNPFPSVVSRMRSEALRLQLWREPDPDLVRLVAGTRARIKLIDPRTWLYKFVKHEAYGVFSALRVCSGGVVVRIMKTLEVAGILTPPQGPNAKMIGGAGMSMKAKNNASAYDVSVCTSLCGNAVLYSRIHSESARTSPQEHVLELNQALRENPCISLTETHIYEGPRLQGAIELFVEYLVKHTLHVNDKSESIVVLCLATGLYAMDLLNEDPGYDGGWYPVSHHEMHKTTDEDATLRRTRGRRGSQVRPDSLSKQAADGQLDPEHATHSEEFYREAQAKMYHPRYSHGEYLQMQKLRREQALCKQEIIRATRAKEPIVVELCVLVDPPSDSVPTAEEGGGEPHESFYVIVRKTINFHFVMTPSGQTTSFVPEFLRYDALYRSVWADREQAIDAINVICTDNIDLTSAHLPGRHLADPCDAHCTFHKFYELSLKLRVAHAYAHGDLVMAYRALFRYMLLKRNVRQIPDLIRMLQRKNIALEFDMLVSKSILIRMLFRERFRSDDSRRKLKARVLKLHFTAYKDAVELLLAKPECIFLPGIRNAVHSSLIQVGKAIDADRAGNSTLHMEQLEELHCFLECLRLSAASSFHQNCPQLDQVCRNFCLELLPMSETAFLHKSK